MNLFKKVFYTSFILVAILLSTTSFAEVKATNVSEPVRLATVNITDAVITSQKDNIFNIHFQISNREGIQTGVKYGIQLTSTSKEGKKIIVDDVSYPDSLTFYAGTTIEKDITYTAPNVSSGEYELMLTSMNSEGFPFAFKSLGQVTISSPSDISIIVDSCFLSVIGEKGNPIYTLDNVVDIDKSESLSISCGVSNSSNKDIKISPVFETYEGLTSYGNSTDIENLKIESFNLKSQEAKNVTLNLPKAKNTGTYNIKLSFNYDGKTTNSVNPKYLIRGKNVSITNIFLDKDSYLKNEIANISVLWVPPVSKLLRTVNNDSYGVVLEVVVKDGNNNCGEPIIKNVNSSLEKFSILMQKNCSNPNVLVTLKDDIGNILDQKSMTVKTDPKNQMPNNFYLIIIIVLMVIASVYLYMKKRSGLKMFAVLLFFVGLSLAHNTSADTFTSLCGSNTAGNGNSVYCTYTIDVGTVNAEEAINTSFIQSNSVSGFYAGPTTVKWNGLNGVINTCPSVPCIASYTNEFTPPVVASPYNGNYDLNVLATWTFAGSYTSNINVPYEVVNGTSGGGGGGGGTTNGGLNVYANPGNINEGQSTVLSWSTYGDVTLVNNGNNCNVFKNNSSIPSYSGPSSYQTGNLYEDTFYYVECSVVVAHNSEHKKFAFLPSSVNKFINNMLPNIAFADVVSTVSGSVTVNVTQNTAPIVSLILNPSNEKNLVRYGSLGLIGTTNLYVNILNLPLGKYCYLKNTTDNSTIKTYGPGPIEEYSDYVPINNLQDNEVVFELMCNDENNTSDSQIVKAQSGTLSSSTSPSGICTIPLNGSSCSSPQTISWTTVNPYPGFNSYVKKDGVATNIGNSNSGTNIPVTVVYGSNIYRLSNQVDGENNGLPVPNEIKSIEIEGKCIGINVWDVTNNKCVEPGGIDLIANPVPENTAIVNQSKTFSSIIKNQGTKDTLLSFYNKFQTATGFQDDLTTPINLVNYNADSMPALTAGSQATATKSITFSTAGTYYVRVCADESTVTTNNNKINEGSFENNNCSNWTTVNVTLAFAPDLISSVTTPTSATFGTPKVFISTITNQGNLSTGAKFYNLFQVATIGTTSGGGSSGGSGGGSAMKIKKDFPILANIFGQEKVTEAASYYYSVIGNYSTVTQMPILTPGGSATATSPSISFPSTGIYYVRACADKNSPANAGVITESNEGNNCGDWAAVNVTSMTLPDLTASSPSPRIATAGIPVTFSSTVSNLGTASTGTGFTGLVQVSLNLSGSPSSDLLTIPMTVLSSGFSKVYSFTPRDPLSAGTYYVRVCADKSSASNTGVIAESNENNNCSVWTKIEVIAGGDQYPELTASNPYIYSSGKGETGFNNKYIHKAEAVGDIIKTFAFNVTNTGTAPVIKTPFPNLFQVSQSPDGSDFIDYKAPVDISDIEIGSYGVAISPAITFKPETNYYMRTCADKGSNKDSGVITELDEGNNCSAWIFVDLSDKPIDGGWSDWDCGECSVPCGGGTQICTRTCTNPFPQNGGDYCVGSSVSTQICNTQSCTVGCDNGATNPPDCNNNGGGGGGGVFNLSFSASPTLIFKSRPSTLTWTSVGATSCSSSQFETGGRTSGNATVNPTSTTTYNITCTDDISGSDSASATVRVISPIIIEN